MLNFIYGQPLQLLANKQIQGADAILGYLVSPLSSIRKQQWATLYPFPHCTTLYMIILKNAYLKVVKNCFKSSLPTLQTFIVFVTRVFHKPLNLQRGILHNYVLKYFNSLIKFIFFSSNQFVTHVVVFRLCADIRFNHYRVAWLCLTLDYKSR